MNKEYEVVPPYFQLTCGLPEKASWTMVPTIGSKTVCLVNGTGYQVDVVPDTSGIAIDKGDRRSRGSSHMVTLRAKKEYAKARLQAKKGSDIIGIDLVALPSREIRTAFHFVRATHKDSTDRTITHQSQRGEMPEAVTLWIRQANSETLNRANVKILDVDDVSKKNDPLIIPGNFGNPIKKEKVKDLEKKLLEFRVHDTHLNVFFVWEMQGAHGLTQTDENICLLGDSLGSRDALVLAHETAHFLLGNLILPSRLDSWNRLTKEQRHTREAIHAHAHSHADGELLARDLHAMGPKIRMVDAVLINENAGNLTKFKDRSK